jgi:hypothetical protein
VSADFWERPARLMRSHVALAGWKGARRPEQIAKGTLRTVAEQVSAADPEEIWRFIVVTDDDGHHIRSAELRELIRRLA